jgi:hypothetical protein
MLASVNRKQLKSFLSAYPIVGPQREEFRAVVLSERSHLIQIWDLESGTQLFVKQSKLSAPFVKAQTDAVNQLAIRNPDLNIPQCFAVCTDAGLVYEVWEWIHAQHALQNELPRVLRRQFCLSQAFSV